MNREEYQFTPKFICGYLSYFFQFIIFLSLVIIVYFVVYVHTTSIILSLILSFIILILSLLYLDQYFIREINFEDEYFIITSLFSKKTEVYFSQIKNITKRYIHYKKSNFIFIGHLKNKKELLNLIQEKGSKNDL